MSMLKFVRRIKAGVAEAVADPIDVILPEPPQEYKVAHPQGPLEL